ncbi:MAG: GGDEF domain-containing protein [Gammaproteobacteria bacterium]|nr:GGDEF domain-containing protein [Gammaproteobacteria bacterium]
MTAPSNIDSENLLQLASALQTTLDAESLIGIFGKHLATLVSHRGLQYTNKQAGIDVTTGDSGPDRVDYPLMLEERLLGHLGVLSAGALSASQKKTVEALIAGLLQPLRNALMYREAVNASARDPLTGVNNRGRFREVMDREVELSRRHGTPLSLIMLDVDRFKSINDTHGHLVGDIALKSIASCTLSCIRDSDILFRYGGEEFCIALANTNLTGACKLAERVRRALEILVVRTSGARLHVTASLGVATLAKEDDAAHLVEKADHSLYRAKALGRNRVATHEDAQEPPVTRR